MAAVEAPRAAVRRAVVPGRAAAGSAVEGCSYTTRAESAPTRSPKCWRWCGGTSKTALAASVSAWCASCANATQTTASCWQTLRLKMSAGPLRATRLLAGGAKTGRPPRDRCMRKGILRRHTWFRLNSPALLSHLPFLYIIALQPLIEEQVYSWTTPPAFKMSLQHDRKRA